MVSVEDKHVLDYLIIQIMEYWRFGVLIVFVLVVNTLVYHELRTTIIHNSLDQNNSFSMAETVDSSKRDSQNTANMQKASYSTGK